MTNFEPILKASICLLIGSLGAPIVYILIGLVAPSGFHDFRVENLSSILAALGMLWLISALITCVIGGICWAPLHHYRIDGFLTYVAIALLIELVIWLVTGMQSWSWLSMLMSSANSICIRLCERIWNRIKN